MTTETHIRTHELTALRLYFPANSLAKATRFWHRLSAPALAQHLLGLTALGMASVSLFRSH